MSYLSKRTRVFKKNQGNETEVVEQYYAITSFWIKETLRRAKKQVYIGRKNSTGYSFNKNTAQWAYLFENTEIEKAYQDFLAENSQKA